MDYFSSYVLWIISDDFRWVVRMEEVTCGVLRKGLFRLSIFPLGYSNSIYKGEDESLKFGEDY